MEIWRKIQIANIFLALVAVVLTVVAFGQPSFVNAAMWAWSLTLWVFMFLVPMPVIERNKRDNQIALALFFLAAVFGAMSINTWLQIEWPATHGFSRGVMVYSAFYLAVAYVFAGWLKMKEKKNK